MPDTHETEPQAMQPASIASATPDSQQGAPAATPSLDPRETVILVHGTFAAPDPADAESRHIQWCEEEHAFVTALDHELAALGSPAACWKHRRGSPEPGQHFVWSGENSWFARREAAESLRAYLFGLGQQGWITHVIAHSHGGNVVLEALDFFQTGIPIWFKGKIVLFGTPVFETRAKLDQVNLIYQTVRILGIGVLWTVAIGAAMFWDRSWSEEKFFTFYNLVAIGVIIFLVFVISVFHDLFQQFWEPGFDFVRMRVNWDVHHDGANVREHVLMIGSRWDEAFQLLHKAKVEPNPFLRQDALAPEPKTVTKPKRRPLAIVHEAALKAIREADHVYFSIESRYAYWLALALNLMIAVSVVAALADWLKPTDRWIADDVLIIALVAALANGVRYPGAGAAAGGLPFRVCFWFGTYCWRMLRGIAMHLLDRRLRTMAWSTLTHFAFGLSGSPLRVHDVEVHKSLPEDRETSFTYLELPDEVVTRVMQARADAFRTTSVAALEKSLEADPNVGLVHPGLVEIASQPLVHTCYYGEPLCIRKAGQWIAAPLRRHGVNRAFVLAPFAESIPPWSTRTETDPRFDDPERAWTL